MSDYKETYEEKQAKRKRENRDFIAKTMAIADQLHANHDICLLPLSTERPMRDFWMEVIDTQYLRNTGTGLSFELYNGRLEIRTSLQTEIQGYYPQTKTADHPNPITCSYTRTPAAIAADIARRLWAKFVPYRDEFYQMVDAEKARQEKYEEFRQSIADRHPDTRPHWNESVIIGIDGWKLDIYTRGEIYKITFDRDIPTETAHMLIDLFRARHNPRDTAIILNVYAEKYSQYKAKTPADLWTDEKPAELAAV